MQRYAELMRTSKNMNDILVVEREINNMQEEIESANGRMNYLSHASVFSTIKVTCYQVLDKNASEENTNSRTGFSDAFMTGWNGLKEIFLTLVTIWPLVILLVLAVVTIRRNVIKQSLKHPSNNPGIK